MSFLKRVLGGGDDSDSVPAWASYFDPQQYREFDSLLVGEFARRGLTPEFDDDRGSARIIGGAGGEVEGSRLGFSNLGQACGQIPRKQWRKAITAHFDRILSAMDVGGRTDSLNPDFETARPALRIRLYPAETEGVERTVSRIVTDGILGVLVYDFPESVVGVLRENTESWNRTDDELFQAALDNVRAAGRIEPFKLPGKSGSEVFGIFADNNIYAATHALILQDYLPPELELGAIVGIPNRHAVLYHPIKDYGAMGALESIIPSAIGMCEKGPGSISPHVYWWQNGVFQRQPTEITNQTLQFNPTEEFIFQVLNRIRPESP